MHYLVKFTLLGTAGINHTETILDSFRWVDLPSIWYISNQITPARKWKYLLLTDSAGVSFIIPISNDISLNV